MIMRQQSEPTKAHLEQQGRAARQASNGSRLVSHHCCVGILPPNEPFGKAFYVPPRPQARPHPAEPLPIVPPARRPPSACGHRTPGRIGKLVFSPSRGKEDLAPIAKGSLIRPYRSVWPWDIELRTGGASHLRLTSRGKGHILGARRWEWLSPGGLRGLQNR